MSVAAAKERHCCALRQATPFSSFSPPHLRPVVPPKVKRRREGGCRSDVSRRRKKKRLHRSHAARRVKCHLATRYQRCAIASPLQAAHATAVT